MFQFIANTILIALSMPWNTLTWWFESQSHTLQGVPAFPITAILFPTFNKRCYDACDGKHVRGTGWQIFLFHLVACLSANAYKTLIKFYELYLIESHGFLEMCVFQNVMCWRQWKLLGTKNMIFGRIMAIC